MFAQTVKVPQQPCRRCRAVAYCAWRVGGGGRSGFAEEEPFAGETGGTAAARPYGDGEKKGATEEAEEGEAEKVEEEGGEEEG